MDETEKMMALKKAYAEIILNTAKEAASRIMASERKAQLCNRDLVLMKDEALRLLLRLKQTMDDKINEVETRSRDQQRQIEVLEAQLQEAEDIVSNLRVELNEAHTKLDRLSNNKTYRQNNNGSSQPVLASKGDPINHAAQGKSSANIYLEESGYFGVPEIPSIIRRKEPRPYLNGCTKRLRPCDGNSLKDITCVEEEKPIDTKEVDDEDPVESMQVLKLLKKKTNRGSRCERNHVSPLKPGSHNMNESDKCDDKITEGVNEEDGEVNRSLELSTQQSSSGSSLNALGSSIETEMKKPCSLNLDVKLLEFSDGLSSPVSKDRVLKYTFQRKRKRESVASDENSLLHDENPFMERMAKKQNGNLEHVNSGEVTESLRDGRRMTEVAHQLISMSEKKWIK